MTISDRSDAACFYIKDERGTAIYYEDDLDALGVSGNASEKVADTLTDFLVNGIGIEIEIQGSIIMSIVQTYIDGLKRAYYENEGKEIWDEFEKVYHGGEKNNINELCRQYPDIPKSLLELLGIIDGTQWREYAGKKFGIYLLGSDIEGYPYYLLSSTQMMNQKNLDWLKDYISRAFEDVEIDERITDQTDHMCWLHFSNCMNNGGTSKLFIDFSPSASGIKGQIVRFLHDPDEIEVIADSFDEYLEMLMEDEYDFINEESMDSMLC